jgi:hypothetical protein
MNSMVAFLMLSGVGSVLALLGGWQGIDSRTGYAVITVLVVLAVAGLGRMVMAIRKSLS